MTAGSRIGKTTAGVAPAGSRPLLGPGARSRCVSWTPLRLFCFSLTLSLSFRWSCFICLWFVCGRHDLCAILHFFPRAPLFFCRGPSRLLFEGRKWHTPTLAMAFWLFENVMLLDFSWRHMGQIEYSWMEIIAKQSTSLAQCEDHITRCKSQQQKAILGVMTLMWRSTHLVRESLFWEGNSTLMFVSLFFFTLFCFKLTSS